MNKLEIARAVNRRSGVQGVIDTTVGLSGYQATLVSFIDDAYTEIQRMRDWKFRRASTIASITEASSTINNTNISSVVFIMYNKKFLDYVEYEDFVTQEESPKYPSKYTIYPGDNSIIINDLDGDYLVSIEYIRSLDSMEDNGSIPILPTDYHMLIVYGAVIALGDYLGNQSLIDTYSTKYSIMMGQLMRYQVPSKTIKNRRFI